MDGMTKLYTLAIIRVDAGVILLPKSTSGRNSTSSTEMKWLKKIYLIYFLIFIWTKFENKSKIEVKYTDDNRVRRNLQLLNKCHKFVFVNKSSNLLVPSLRVNNTQQRNFYSHTVTLHWSCLGAYIGELIKTCFTSPQICVLLNSKTWGWRNFSTKNDHNLKILKCDSREGRKIEKLQVKNKKKFITIIYIIQWYLKNTRTRSNAWSYIFGENFDARQ